LSYRVEIKKSAGKALDAIPADDRERILEALARATGKSASCRMQKTERTGWLANPIPKLSYYLRH
jgi:RNA binding exosome subunit